MKLPLSLEGADRKTEMGVAAATLSGLDYEVRAQNLEHWSQTISDAYGSLDIVPDKDKDFTASLSRRNVDRLMTVDLAASSQAFHRTKAMVSLDSTNDLVVSMVVRGEGLIIQDGRTCTLGPGDFAFMESARPYSMILRCAGTGRLHDFTWPREAIGLTEGESSELTARAFRADSPMGKWLSPMLMNLLAVDNGISPAGAIRVAAGIADLMVATALELSQPGEADTHSRRQYADMLCFIESNLDNLQLSAESIGDAFYVSTRTVHRLFARFGHTVAVTVRDRRLEACRQMMLSPTHRYKSIGFISSQYGFSSLQVFSRTFTAKYGTGPKEYRSQRI
jgi:AraC-like DNA-binding protein